MNLRDLKYLVALVELEHFGKAADQCFVSQPTLSMQGSWLSRATESLPSPPPQNRTCRTTASGSR